MIFTLIVLWNRLYSFLLKTGFMNILTLIRVKATAQLIFRGQPHCCLMFCISESLLIKTGFYFEVLTKVVFYSEEEKIFILESLVIADKGV